MSVVFNTDGSLLASSCKDKVGEVTRFLGYPYISKFTLCSRTIESEIVGSPSKQSRQPSSKPPSSQIGKNKLSQIRKQIRFTNYNNFLIFIFYFILKIYRADWHGWVLATNCCLRDSRNPPKGKWSSSIPEISRSLSTQNLLELVSYFVFKNYLYMETRALSNFSLTLKRIWSLWAFLWRGHLLTFSYCYGRLFHQILWGITLYYFFYGFSSSVFCFMLFLFWIFYFFSWCSFLFYQIWC